MKGEEEEEKAGESPQSQNDCRETPAFQAVLKHEWLAPRHFRKLAKKN